MNPLWKGRKGAAATVGRITHEYQAQEKIVPRIMLSQVQKEIGPISQRSAILIANGFSAGDADLHPLICLVFPREGDVQMTSKRCERSGPPLTLLSAATLASSFRSENPAVKPQSPLALAGSSGRAWPSAPSGAR